MGQLLPSTYLAPPSAPPSRSSKSSLLPRFLLSLLLFLSLLLLSHQFPFPSPLSLLSSPPAPAFIFDLHSHRGARGLAPESTLFAFAAGLSAGATTLELDVTLSKDGTAVVWHDEFVLPEKCSGEAVGRRIEDLSLAEIKALDCGHPLPSFPLQTRRPNARIQTLDQVLSFGLCVSPRAKGGVQWNVESKVRPAGWNSSFTAEQYTETILEVLKGRDVLDRVIFQSFYWRTLSLSRLLAPTLRTSALIAPFILSLPAAQTAAWTDGHLPAEGNSTGERVALAAASLGAHILSPAHGGPGEVGAPGYEAFTDPSMVRAARAAGMQVLPWTVDAVATAEHLVQMGVEGVITDYPDLIAGWARRRGWSGKRYGEGRIQKCLRQALARDR